MDALWWIVVFILVFAFGAGVLFGRALSSPEVDEAVTKLRGNIDYLSQQNNALIAMIKRMEHEMEHGEEW